MRLQGESVQFPPSLSLLGTLGSSESSPCQELCELSAPHHILNGSLRMGRCAAGVALSSRRMLP